MLNVFKYNYGWGISLMKAQKYGESKGLQNVRLRRGANRD